MSLPLIAQTLIVPGTLAEPAIARWLVVMVALGLTALVGIASFKGAKRGHRD